WPPPAVGPPPSTHHQLVPRCRARTVHATSSAHRYELGKTQRSATTARPTSATPGATRQLAPPREVTPPAPPPPRASTPGSHPTNSYPRTELVRCTLRARHTGTSSAAGARSTAPAAPRTRRPAAHPPARPRRASPTSGHPANSYRRTELVRCTLRARHAGTASARGRRARVRCAGRPRPGSVARLVRCRAAVAPGRPPPPRAPTLGRVERVPPDVVIARAVRAHTRSLVALAGACLALAAVGLGGLSLAGDDLRTPPITAGLPLLGVGQACALASAAVAGVGLVRVLRGVGEPGSDASSDAVREDVPRTTTRATASRLAVLMRITLGACVLAITVWALVASAGLLGAFVGALVTAQLVVVLALL